MAAHFQDIDGHGQSQPDPEPSHVGEFSVLSDLCRHAD
jgi:hypothetical protein